MKFAGFLSAIIGVASMPTLSIAQAEESEFTFDCQTRDGVLTTVAQSSDGEVELPVFLWKSDVLPEQSDPTKVCTYVSQKMDNYARNYDVSNVSFIGTAIENVPAVCMNNPDTRSDCGIVLFTLPPAEENAALIAGKFVDSILSPNLNPKRDAETR